MHRKSFTITVALVAGLALGIVFAPMARGSIALAQTQPPAQNQPRSGIGSLRNLFLDKLAAALNIQRSALDSAITSAGNSTVDEAVQQGSLTQAQGDALKNRLQSGDVGPLFGGHRGFRGGHELFGLKQAMFNAAAGALGITTDELRSALRNGQTVAQLAQAHNTAEQAVTSAALAAAKTQLDQAVANGSLTQAQADDIYTRLQQAGLRFDGPGGRNAGRRLPRVPRTPAPVATPGATSF